MAETCPASAFSSRVTERSRELFDAHRRAIWVQTDRLFAVFLPIQLAVLVLLALWITPHTWAGHYYKTHVHVWIAALLGAVITTPPVVLACLRAGEPSTRYAVAGAQMLMSALLIHVTGGHLETHFHVFGSLAILAFYRTWQVFIPAITVVALDHMLRGIYWPQSVFGVLTGSAWRWIEHAAWVTFEAAFLIPSCFRSISEMQNIATQRAELETTNHIIENRVKERTEQLEGEMQKRQLLEAQLLQVHKLESIGQLAAGIAHEINTPIQYISDNHRFLGQSFASLSEAVRLYRFDVRATGDKRSDVAISSPQTMENVVELDYLLAEVPNALRDSEEGLERIAVIVRALKEFSHPVVAEYGAMDVNLAIQNTVAVCRNRWDAAGQVTLRLQPDLPHIRARQGEINQVILNVLLNAADAIASRPTDLRAIHISTTLEETAVVVRISDNGPGIPADIQPRIFTPFLTTKGVGKGTGQGLYLARMLVVRNHGGAIEFESTSMGTTFTIRLQVSGPSKHETHDESWRKAEPVYASRFGSES